MRSNSVVNRIRKLIVVAFKLISTETRADSSKCYLADVQLIVFWFWLEYSLVQCIASIQKPCRRTWTCTCIQIKCFMRTYKVERWLWLGINEPRKTIPCSARRAHANVITFRAQMHSDALAVFLCTFFGTESHSKVQRLWRFLLHTAFRSCTH